MRESRWPPSLFMPASGEEFPLWAPFFMSVCDALACGQRWRGGRVSLPDLGGEGCALLTCFCAVDAGIGIGVFASAVGSLLMLLRFWAQKFFLPEGLKFSSRRKIIFIAKKIYFLGEEKFSVPRSPLWTCFSVVQSRTWEGAWEGCLIRGHSVARWHGAPCEISWGRATCGRTSVMPMGGFCGGRFCARGAWSALSGVGIAYSDSLV